MLRRFQFQLFHTFQVHKHANILKDVVWLPFGFVVSGSVFVYGLVSMFLNLTPDFFYNICFGFFLRLYSVAESLVHLKLFVKDMCHSVAVVGSYASLKLKKENTEDLIKVCI